MFPVVLAHGALGPFDEVLFLAVGVVFVALMVIAWIRSRNSAPDPDDEPPTDGDAQASAADPIAETRPDHFPLA